MLTFTFQLKPEERDAVLLSPILWRLSRPRAPVLSLAPGFSDRAGTSHGNSMAVGRGRSDSDGRHLREAGENAVSSSFYIHGQGVEQARSFSARGVEILP